MTDNKNTILAVVLSALVLIGWQFFVSMPQEKARREQLQAQQQKQGAPNSAQPSSQTPPAPTQPGTPQVPGQAAAPSPAAPVNRTAALAASPRVPIATDNVLGSHRRYRAGTIPRNRRSEIAASHPAVAVGHGGSFLR